MRTLILRTTGDRIVSTLATSALTVALWLGGHPGCVNQTQVTQTQETAMQDDFLESSTAPELWIEGSEEGLVMVPARRADRPVWRAMVESTQARETVRVAGDSGDVVCEIQPRSGRAVVEYNPGNGTLVQLSGEWAAFEYRSDEARHVMVAGTFNGWSQDANPLVEVEPGLWRTLISAPTGHHYYKFVVDGEWLMDPLADPELEEVGGYGNSGVVFGMDVRDLPEAQAGQILRDYLLHAPDDVTQFSRDGDDVRIAVWALAGDVEQVSLRVYADDGAETAMDLPSAGTLRGMERWGGVVRWPVSLGERYSLIFNDGDVELLMGASGIVELSDSIAGSSIPIVNPYTVVPQALFPTPEWSRSAIWYQVFPERFRNGNPGNDPGDGQYELLLPWHLDWFETHTAHGEIAGQINFYHNHGNVWRRRFGGDLQGLLNELDGIKAMGFTALYLNPVFEAESMHKYDASDFRHIDHAFGAGDEWPVAGEVMDDPSTWVWTESDQLFLSFIEAAHEHGLRVIIDGVFNHVGQQHPAFQDVLAKGQASAYADWFEITDWGHGRDPGSSERRGQPGGIQWAAWDQPNGALPAFKKNAEQGLAPGPRQHIMDITRRWMDPNGDGDPSDGIDGWRLDVPNDIPSPFWRDWRVLVKSINPDAYITGEIWSDASHWLEGDQFDAVMNYPFASAGQDFLVDRDTAISPSQVSERLYELYFRYPLSATRVMQNLYSSHDTDRLASMFVNPDRPYDGANRLQDNGPDYDRREPTLEETRRQLLAAALQYTFVGAPMVYYGDEAGMWGPDDPSNRMPMAWADTHGADHPMVRRGEITRPWYARLGELRQSLPGLSRPEFRVIVASDDEELFVFQRGIGPEAVVVVINRSAAAQSFVLPLAIGEGSSSILGWVNQLEQDEALDQDARGEDALWPGHGLRVETKQEGGWRIEVPAISVGILTPVVPQPE